MNLNTLLIEAVKAKNQIKVNTLRLLKSEVEKLEKSNKPVDLIKIVQKAITSRTETLTYCEKGNRLEDALILNGEIDYLNSFLPTQITEVELVNIINSFVQDFNLIGIKDMKKLIGLVNSQVEGKIDSKLIGKNCKIALT